MNERVLEVSGLISGYGSVRILHGIDVHVDKGEFVTIIGPNGCGKSTFLKVVFGLATREGGGIEHMREEISGWSTEDTSSQEAGLFTLAWLPTSLKMRR